MNYKYFVMFSYIFLILCNQPVVLTANYQPTPEEIALYQQELEAYVSTLQNQFDSWIATLPPEEQQKVLEEQKMIDDLISNMDEKEFNALLEEVLKEESFLNNVAEPTVESAVETNQVFETKKEIIPALDLSKYESIVTIIDLIIKKTDSFLVKVNSIPDMALRVDRWINVKNITTLPIDKDWKHFIQDIEKFCQQLGRLKDRDPETKAYKYLDALKANKVILDSLDELNKVLIENEPIITIATFGLEPLSKQARKAIKVIIVHYSEFLYKSKSAEELDKVFAQFDPEAEKRRKAVEASRTQAAQPVSTVTQPAIIAGQPYIPGQPYISGNPYTGSQPPYTPSQPAQSQPAQPAQPSQPATATQQNPQVSNSGQTLPTFPTTDVSADQFLAKVDADLSTISAFIASNGAFTEIKTNLLDTTKTITESDPLIAQLIPNLDSQISSCLSDIATFAARVKTLSPALQKTYTDSLKVSWEKNGIALRMISNNLNEIVASEASWNTIPEQKRIAYFKTKDLPVTTMVDQAPGLPPIQQETPAIPGTMFSLKQGLEKLKTAISNFPA